MQPEAEPVVEDGEDFRGGGALGIKVISLEQYRRCCIEGSKEMKKGGRQEKMIGGSAIVVEIPNQREIFINSVKTLEGVLTPKIIEHKEIEEKIKLNDDKIEALSKEIKARADRLTEACNRQAGASDYELRGRKIDFKASAEVIFDYSENSQVRLYREKLVILSLLLNKLNYFDEEGASN